MGLPVAIGETKIGISAWVSDLYDGVDAHMDADALNADENTVTIGKTPGTDYAIVPLLAQVEYPADGAVSEIILPDGVELLSYLSTDYEPIPADEQEQAEILHQTYSEQSAAATGLYVKSLCRFYGAACLYGFGRQFAVKKLSMYRSARMPHPHRCMPTPAMTALPPMLQDRLRRIPPAKSPVLPRRAAHG